MGQKVRDNKPPLWVVNRLVSPLIRRLLPTPLGRLLPGVALLRFRGRRSGTEYSVATGIFDYRGAQLSFTDGTWLANFHGGAPVDVVRRGRLTRAYGEAVSDPAYVGPAIRSVLDSGTSAMWLGLKIDRNYQPTDEELTSLRTAVVIRPLGDEGNHSA
jgi:hypothetical protein